MLKVQIALVTMAILLLSVARAHAGTPVTKEMANKFYAACLAKADARMTAGSHNAMCACSAAMLMKNMSAEDMKALGDKDKSGRAAQDKMLVNVYAPCSGDGIKDILNARCVKSPRIQATGNVAGICGCVAGLTGDWYALAGREIMAQALKINPNLMDPVAPVMNVPTFISEEEKNIQSCIREH